jgi:hypothetical protein
VSGRELPSGCLSFETQMLMETKSLWTDPIGGLTATWRYSKSNRPMPIPIHDLWWIAAGGSADTAPGFMKSRSMPALAARTTEALPDPTANYCAFTLSTVITPIH